MNPINDRQWARREGIGEKLKAIRQGIGVTQGQLGKAIGTLPSFVSRLESGYDFLSLRRQLTYFKAIGVDPFEILDIKQEKLGKD